MNVPTKLVGDDPLISAASTGCPVMHAATNSSLDHNLRNHLDPRASSYDIDIYSDSAILEPYSHYKNIRDLGGAVFLLRNRLWAISRYVDVREALRQPLLFSSARGVAANDATNNISMGNLLASVPDPYNSSQDHGCTIARANHERDQRPHRDGGIVCQIAANETQSQTSTFRASKAAPLSGGRDKNPESRPVTSGETHHHFNLDLDFRLIKCLDANGRDAGHRLSDQFT